MATPEQGDKPTSSPLDAEREKLRKAGYTETEISQILVARALGSSAHSADAPASQGVLSGTLSSVMAIGSYARGTVFTIRHDLAAIFDATALASARVSAAAMLVFKVAVISVLAYAGWQEWHQHIISATEIADSQARKIKAEECSARIKAIIDTVPMNKIAEATEIVQRDCDPTYAAREAQCDARSKAIVSDLDHLKPGDNEGVSRVVKQVDGFKEDCQITEERQRLLKAAAGRAAALFQQGSEHPNSTDNPATCDEKFKTLLTAIETVDFKDKDPTTTLKTKIDQYKGECAVTEAQQAAAKAAFEKRAEKLAKLTTVLARFHEIDQIDAAHKAGNYAEALKLSEAHVAATEADEIKKEGKAGKLTAGALIGLSWEALFAREFSKSLDASERAIKLSPNDLVPVTNQAHALMLLGRTDEAKAIYLAHKGEPLQGKTWEKVISEDFGKLHQAGITHPMMAEIETALPGQPTSAAPSPTEPLSGSLAAGSPAPDPDVEAVRRYKLGADRGDADAQMNLGMMYGSGRGGLARDPLEAARLYKLSADQGNAIAQLELAYMYENGDILPKDWREAARLYRLSADQGNADAQANLADFYERGDAGLRKNACEAMRLRKLAAAQGNAYAERNLKEANAARCKP